MNSSNQLCSICHKTSPKQICLCQVPPIIACDLCLEKHQRHPLLPLSASPFLSDQQYLRDFLTRTGPLYAKTLKDFHDNISAIDTWQSQVKETSEQLISLIEDRQFSLKADLETLKQKLSDAMRTAEDQRNDSIADPNPQLTSPIAIALRKCDSWPIVRCQLDQSMLLTQLGHLATSSKMVIEVKKGVVLGLLPGNQPNSQLVTIETDTVAGINDQQRNSNGIITLENIEKGYNGFGRLRLNDESVIESEWTNGYATGIGKCLWADGSFYVGNCEKHMKNLRNSKKSARKWLLLLTLAVGILAVSCVASTKHFEEKGVSTKESDPEEFSSSEDYCMISNEKHYQFADDTQTKFPDLIGAIHSVSFKPSKAILLTAFEIAVTPQVDSPNSSIEIIILDASNHTIFTASPKMTSVSTHISLISLSAGLKLTSNSAYTVVCKLRNTHGYRAVVLHSGKKQEGITIQLTSSNYAAGMVNGSGPYQGVFWGLKYKDICS